METFFGFNCKVRIIKIRYFVNSENQKTMVQEDNIMVYLMSLQSKNFN